MMSIALQTDLGRPQEYRKQSVLEVTASTMEPVANRYAYGDGSDIDLYQPTAMNGK
jgi:hypothetical protein